MPSKKQKEKAANDSQRTMPYNTLRDKLLHEDQPVTMTVTIKADIIDVRRYIEQNPSSFQRDFVLDLLDECEVVVTVIDWTI